ncbi:MAG: hypothetical protein J0L84_11315, partial [Verrucomicrobia bacterium]|nr:hypothetical protein [Verrucomicrobiota bacterium]
MNSRFLQPAVLALAWVLSFPGSSLLTAADSGVVIREGANRTIPIAISGFSDDVRKILEFDLYVVGFDINPAKPQYLLKGTPGGSVQGALSDANNAQTLFARAYPGATARVQAHALANDVVKTLLQVPGVANTRIAFKNSTGSRNARAEIVSEIWASDYDGANAVSLTGDGSIAAAPCWVPGKLELFYASYRAGRPEIYLQDLRTGDRQRVFSFP